MYPAPFALERFFAEHEFSARYLLSTSDCQGLAMADLLDRADPDLRKRWDTLRLGYTESQGLRELREVVAAQYADVGAAEVLIAAPEEAIFLAMNSLLEPGDHVICTLPGYQSLYQLALAIGCEVEFWTPREEAGWFFDPADLGALLRPDTKLVVWNFPHNPTGSLPTAEAFSRMIASVGAVGAWLFSDEMYRLLEPTPELRLPPAVDRYERALSLSGMSKAYGLAGLRIGWAAVRDAALLGRMKALKDYTTICSSAPSELLALMALRAPDSILDMHRRRVRANVEAAQAFFAQHSTRFACVPPRAGTVCFPRLLADPTGGAAGAGSPSAASAGAMGAGAQTGERPPTRGEALAYPGGAEAFCLRVLSDTGVLLLPSTVYGYGNSHFRLGLGREDFKTGLEVLDSYLRDGPGQGPSRI